MPALKLKVKDLKLGCAWIRSSCHHAIKEKALQEPVWRPAPLLALCHRDSRMCCTVAAKLAVVQYCRELL